TRGRGQWPPGFRRGVTRTAPSGRGGGLRRAWSFDSIRWARGSRVDGGTWTGHGKADGWWSRACYPSANTGDGHKYYRLSLFWIAGVFHRGAPLTLTQLMVPVLLGRVLGVVQLPSNPSIGSALGHVKSRNPPIFFSRFPLGG